MGEKKMYMYMCTCLNYKASSQSCFPVADRHQASANDEPGGHVLHGQHRQCELQGHRAPLSKQAPQHAHPATQGRGGRVHGPGEGEEGLWAAPTSPPRGMDCPGRGRGGAAALPHAPLALSPPRVCSSLMFKTANIYLALTVCPEL